MEHRREPRKSVRLSFQYNLQTDSFESEPREATLIDLSERGIRFEAAEKLPVGTKLKLNFGKDESLEKEEHMIKSDGIVVWSIQPNTDEPIYRVGLNYL